MNRTYNGLYLGQPPRIFLRDDPDSPRLRAKAEFVLNDAFAVKNIRIVEVDGRIIVGFPSRRLPDGRHVDTTFPVSREAREWITPHILDAYRRAVAYRDEWSGPADDEPFHAPPSSGGHPTEEIAAAARDAELRAAG